MWSLSLSSGEGEQGPILPDGERSCAAPSLPQALMTLSSPEQPGPLTPAPGCSSTAPTQAGDPGPLVWPPCTSGDTKPSLWGEDLGSGKAKQGHHCGGLEAQAWCSGHPWEAQVECLCSQASDSHWKCALHPTCPQQPQTVLATQSLWLCSSYTCCKAIGAPLQPFSPPLTPISSAQVIWSHPRATCCSGQLLPQW